MVDALDESLYSLAFSKLDHISLLRELKLLSANDRVLVDARFVVRAEDLLGFEPLNVMGPGAAVPLVPPVPPPPPPAGVAGARGRGNNLVVEQRADEEERVVLVASLRRRRRRLRRRRRRWCR